MLDTQKLQLFWQTYLATLPEHHIHRFKPLPDAWSFGNSSQIANKLGKLVVNGIKTATCSHYAGENILDVDKQKETAITANFLDLIKQFKKDLTLGIVEKIIIEGQEGYCVLVGCENNLILLVLANKEIVKGWLFLEIKRLVKKINNQ